MCYSGLCKWEDHQGDCQWPGWYKKSINEYPCPSPEEMETQAERLEEIENSLIENKDGKTVTQL